MTDRAHEATRVVLVGCGYWGPKVLRAAASVPQFRVVGLVDLDPARPEALRSLYPAARVSTSLAEVLAAEPVDAVIVATNPKTHVEVASEALAAGTHVLVEKPLALSAAECRALGEEARAAGLVLMVGHTFRYSPAVNHVHRLVASGELGDVYYVDSQRLNLGRVRADVDAIWNFAPHDISILNHWLGRSPEAVYCHGYSYLQPGIVDLAFIMLEYGTAVAHVQISWLSPNKVRRMTVAGSEKMVVYDDVANQVALHDAGIDREHSGRSFANFESFGEFRLIQRVGDIHLPRLQAAEPLVVQCRHFHECIVSGTEPATGAGEAAAVVEVLEAASASLADGGARVALGAGAPAPAASVPGSAGAADEPH